MTRRARAVAEARRRAAERSTPAYRPSPFPWRGVLLGASVVMVLAVLTAPRSER